MYWLILWWWLCIFLNILDRDIFGLFKLIFFWKDMFFFIFFIVCVSFVILCRFGFWFWCLIFLILCNGKVGNSFDFFLFFFDKVNRIDGMIFDIFLYFFNKYELILFEFFFLVRDVFWCSFGFFIVFSFFWGKSGLGKFWIEGRGGIELMGICCFLFFFYLFFILICFFFNFILCVCDWMWILFSFFIRSWFFLWFMRSDFFKYFGGCFFFLIGFDIFFFLKC